MKEFILLCLLFTSLYSEAQDDPDTKDLFYSISIGAGAGKSPNFEDGNYGIGGMFDFTLQKNKSLATIGYRGTGEFGILSTSIPKRTMTSVDLMYGRLLTDREMSVSIHAGIGLVENLERGEFLYYSGSGFLGTSYFERIRTYTIGLPVSAKELISLSRHFGLGIEGYLNLNNQNTFYGLNLSGSFKKYKFSGKKEV